MFFRLVEFCLILLLTTSVVLSAHEQDNGRGDVFTKFHKSVVSVGTSDTAGSGMVLSDLQDDLKPETVIITTAAHVVNSSLEGDVWVDFYSDERLKNGNHLKRRCNGMVKGIDIVSDTAVVIVDDCSKCFCPEGLQVRTRPIYPLENIFILGDSETRLNHSVLDGVISTVDLSRDLLEFYADLPPSTPLRATRVHPISARANHGDSGCPVVDSEGEFVGIISFKHNELVFAVTAEEVLLSSHQILSEPEPELIMCTAHESAFLGRVFWGGKFGLSVKMMDAVARVQDAPFFALADVTDEAAYGFTFSMLWDSSIPNSPPPEHSLYDCIRDDRYYGCADAKCIREGITMIRPGEENQRRWAVFRRTDSQVDEKLLSLSRAVARDVELEIRVRGEAARKGVVEEEKRKYVDLEKRMTKENELYKQDAMNEKTAHLRERKIFMAVYVGMFIVLAALRKIWKP